MAFMAIILGLGLLFYILLGFRYSIIGTPQEGANDFSKPLGYINTAYDSMVPFQPGVT